MIQADDIAFIWENGKEAGIRARIRITSSPDHMDEPEFERRYYVYPFVLIDQARGKKYKLGRFNGTKAAELRKREVVKTILGRLGVDDPLQDSEFATLADKGYTIERGRNRLLDCEHEPRRVKAKIETTAHLLHDRDKVERELKKSMQSIFATEFPRLTNYLIREPEDGERLNTMLEAGKARE
jgi:hypothetical protein